MENQKEKVPKMIIADRIFKLIKRLFIQKKIVFMTDNPIYKKYDIGKYTYGRPKILDWNNNTTLIIGNYCSIAADVKIFLGGNHRPDWITTYPFNRVFKEYNDIEGHPTSKGDVIIGNDVWIGNGAIILSGITIGDGAVIGTGTIVTKDVQPYSIVVGNPGKVIKKRFDDKTIEFLLKIRWWEWNEEKIKENIRLLQSNDMPLFLNKNKIKELQYSNGTC